MYFGSVHFLEILKDKIGLLSFALLFKGQNFNIKALSSFITEFVHLRVCFISFYFFPINYKFLTVSCY